MHRATAVVAGMFVAIASAGVLADDKRDCLEGSGHDLRVKACSAVIDHSPNDAGAYYARAVALQFEGETDRAIADFNKAIELNPNHAAAYDGRGRAYVSKGDYTNAVLDVTKAGELARAAKPQPMSQPKTAVRAPKEVKAAARATAPVKAPTNPPANKALEEAQVDWSDSLLRGKSDF
jgi:tetratricopeptide (TPR) repeat protein